MEKIEKLTQEQEARFPEFVDRWMKIGLSTEKADHAKAEDAIARAYQVAGLTPTSHIVWCGSPLSLAIIDTILRDGSVQNSVRDSVWDSVRTSVGTSVWNSVGTSVWNSVRNSVWNSVGASVWNSVRDSVGTSVWNSVRDSVGTSVGASVRASVRASVGASVRDSVYGQQDAGWLSFYSYFLEVLDIKDCEKLKPLMDLAEHSNWWIPRANLVYCSEKPIKCEVDERGRLHSLNGMAIEYIDGFGVFAIHGVVFKEELHKKVSSNSMLAKDILQIENMEQRMVALKLRGPEQLLVELEAKKLHASTRGNELYKIENIFSQDAYFLKYACPSTGRVYVSGIDPEVAKTQLDADACMAWKHHLTNEEYGVLEYEA